MISKSCVSLRVGANDTPARRLSILRGTALSLQAVCSGSPPHRAFVSRLLELTAGHDAIKPLDEPWKMLACNSGVEDARTWLALERRYGWTPALQREWERELASIPQAMEFGRYPICAMLQARDSDEPHSDAHDSLAHDGVSVAVAQFHNPTAEELEHKYDDTGSVVEPACPQREPLTEQQVAAMIERRAAAAEEWDEDAKFDYVEMSTIAATKHMLVGKKTYPFNTGCSLTYAEVFGRPTTACSFHVAGQEVSPHAVALENFEVRAKGIGGAAHVALTLAMHRIVNNISSHVAECVECTESVVELLNMQSHSEETKTFEELVFEPAIGAVDAGHTSACSFQTQTRCFNVGAPYAKQLSYGQVFSQLFQIPLDKLELFIITSPSGASWTDDATSDYVVRAKGIGGSGQNVSKAEKMLDRIINYTGIDEMSRGALMNMVDPFHDHPVRSNGFFDNVCAPSVPECYKTSLSVSCPTGITGNWDLNLVLFPDLAPNNATNWVNPTATTNASNLVNSWISTNTGNNTSFPGPISTVVTWGGLQAYSTVAGQSLNFASNQGLDVLPTRAKFGPSRVYAMGFEVINNTAPLYQQGVCTVWRQPSPDPRSATTQQYVASATGGSLPGYFYGNASTVIAATPPINVAEALVLQGSRQWHAKEGCMVVSTLNGDELPVINGQTTLTGYTDTLDTVTAISTANPTGLGGVFGLSASSNTTSMGFPRTYLTPFNMCGAYFTGLSNSTTLTVNVRIYAEIFPSDLTNPLTPLAQPSCPFDERALRLYSEIAKGLPPGVMLCENGFGDFFSDIISKVSNFVAPIAGVVSKIAGVIPHPAAQAVARIAGTVGGMAESMRGGQTMPESERVYAQEVPAAPAAPRVIYAPRARTQLVIPKQAKLRRRAPVQQPSRKALTSRIPVLRRR
jgi:hypothetical protein